MTAELQVTRILDAPRELVFQCLTSAEHLTHFWGPAGSDAPVQNIIVDCRPGGRFEVLMTGEDGGSYRMRVVYDEVLPPEVLAWTDIDTGMRTRSTLIDLGNDRTQLNIQQTNAPEFAATPEAQAGFNTSLDKLVRYLRTASAKGST